MEFKETLSILADIATIITAIISAGVLLKINFIITSNGNKNTKQTAIGSRNKQSAKQ